MLSKLHEPRAMREGDSLRMTPYKNLIASNPMDTAGAFTKLTGFPAPSGACGLDALAVAHAIVYPGRPSLFPKRSYTGWLEYEEIKELADIVFPQIPLCICGLGVQTWVTEEKNAGAVVKIAHSQQAFGWSVLPDSIPAGAAHVIVIANHGGGHWVVDVLTSASSIGIMRKFVQDVMDESDSVRVRNQLQHLQCMKPDWVCTSCGLEGNPDDSALCMACMKPRHGWVCICDKLNCDEHVICANCYTPRAIETESKDEGWNCECGFCNSSLLQACELCEKPKAHTSVSTSTGWACTACTFVNTRNHNVCEMCESCK